MKKFALIAALLVATTATAQDDALREAARAYVESDVQQAFPDDMLSPAGVMAQMGLQAGQIPADKMQRLSEIVSEELTALRPALENAMIEGAVDNFTLEEIEALNAFYSSEVGASAMQKVNPYMADTMQRLAPEFQQMQANLVRRIQEEMSQ